jgi:hypothetical protein
MVDPVILVNKRLFRRTPTIISLGFLHLQPQDLQVLLYYSLVARQLRITYNHSPLLKDGLLKRQRRGKTRMVNTIFNTLVILREV